MAVLVAVEVCKVKIKFGVIFQLKFTNFLLEKKIVLWRQYIFFAVLFSFYGGSLLVFALQVGDLVAFVNVRFLGVGLLAFYNIFEYTQTFFYIFLKGKGLIRKT